MTSRMFAQLWIAILVLGAGALPLSAQDEEKGIKAEVFIANRPKESSGRRTTVSRKPTYKTSASATAAVPPPGKEFAQVGVTVWRFRPATSADKTKELVEEEDSPPTQWSLERISEGTLLAPGQRVRLGIESLSRDGHLYVINREQYADGSFGEARLVFPTKRTPEGGNRVKAGRIIYIPGAPRYFRIKPSQTSKGHVAEVLTVLVSAKPLVDPAQFGNGPWVIDAARLADWQKQWTAVPTKFEMEGGVGQTMTDKEQAAGLVQSELTQDEPVPQTIYRLTVKPEDTLLVTVPLSFVNPKAQMTSPSKPEVATQKQRVSKRRHAAARKKQVRRKAATLMAWKISATT